MIDEADRDGDGEVNEAAVKTFWALLLLGPVVPFWGRVPLDYSKKLVPTYSNLTGGLSLTRSKADPRYYGSRG